MGYFQRRKAGQTQEYERQFDTSEYYRRKNEFEGSGNYFDRDNTYGSGNQYRNGSNVSGYNSQYQKGSGSKDYSYPDNAYDGYADYSDLGNQAGNKDINYAYDSQGNGDFNEYGEYIGYDDGFDELNAEDGEDSYDEEYEDELTEEEEKEEKKQRYRLITGVWDLTAVLAGVGVILVLVAFLTSVAQFVTSDMSQTISIISMSLQK